MRKKQESGVRVSPETVEVLGDLRLELGMFQKDIADRLVLWFKRVPPSVRAVVLGSVPADMKAEYLQKVQEFFTAELDRLTSGEVRVPTAATTPLREERKPKFRKHGDDNA